MTIGTIIQWASNTLPTGWLLCDGSAVSRTTYADLFDVIGTTFGTGDGSTTFNLPDLRGRVAVGKSSETEFDALGETGGEKTHTLTIDEMPSHNHKDSINVGGSSSMDTVTYVGIGDTAQYYVNTSAVGGGQAHNNLQPYIVVNYIIKASSPDAIKISDLEELTSADSNDVLAIVDTSADETKKITLDNLMASNGTSLYKNSSGVSGNVSLSDNPTNYKVLLVKHKNNDSGNIYSNTIISPVLNEVYTFTRTEVDVSNSQAYIFAKNYTIASNQLTAGTANLYGLHDNTFSNYNNIRVLEVIGYK